MIGDVLEMEWWWKWEDYAVDVAPQFALRLWAISPQQTTFYLRTLFMNYCVIQHVKLPFVAYEEARHQNVTGLHVICIMQAFEH
mgnify:CR=1 FL=1